MPLKLPAQRHDVAAGPGARLADAVNKLRTAGGADDAATGSYQQARGALSHHHAQTAVHPECCVRHCTPGSDSGLARLQFGEKESL